MSRRRGFTLLEVLVAVAILGLGMTVVLSSQVGLFTSAQRAQNLSIATNLGRCKMSEVELQLQKESFPSSDLDEEGPCCEDESEKSFHCSWKIERIELPQPVSLGASGDGGVDDEPGGLGALGVLAQAQNGGGGIADGGLSGLASALGGAAAGGTQGMAPIVMSMVYPDLKPMLEASIRKVTVKVQWREGKRERDLPFTQYLTNPQQGGLDPNAAKDLSNLVEE